MAQIFLQQTDANSVDPIGDFGTGGTASVFNENNAKTATNGGAPGTGTATIFEVLSGQSNCDGMMWETAAGECDTYSCPAGNWIVPFRVGAINDTGVNWTDCWIIRVDSSGVAQELIGHSSPNLAVPISGAVILTATVAGFADTFSAGDRVVILLHFNNTGGSNVQCAFLSDQVITTPMNSTGPSFTRIATKFMADLLGLTSGSQRAFSIAGCIKSASAAMVRYVANFLGWASGSQMAFSIASCKGPIRTADYVGWSSGSQQVLAIADCCQPVASGSRTSGSGVSGSRRSGSGQSGSIATDTDLCIAAGCAGGVAAAQFSFTLGSMANTANCDNCPTILDGTFALAYIGTCHWRGGSGTSTCNGVVSSYTFDLTLDPFTHNDVILNVTYHNISGGFATEAGYEHVLSGWDCVSPLTLTRTSLAPTPFCSGWPATLTISPV